MSAGEIIILIGAGVIGLSTATLLQRKYPSKTIVIIAAELPTTSSPSADYASMWAGAHYRPIPGSTAQLEDEARLAFHTAETMRVLARESPEAGVEIMKGVEYLENPPPENLILRTGDMYAGPDDHFRVFRDDELPEGVKWGCEYETYCVNVAIYCNWLLDNFIAKGGKVVQRKLSGVLEAFYYAAKTWHSDIGVVVNCSGRNFDQDQKTKIIRGQTILVKQQYHQTVTRQKADGIWTFLIPRPRGGGTIVGGSKEIDDVETQVRPETRSSLLRQAASAFPDFVDSEEKFDILKDNVGRRPWREGGLRLEVERLSPTHAVVHGYGAGGRGYELSWGAAHRIADMVEKCWQS